MQPADRIVIGYKAIDIAAFLTYPEHRLVYLDFIVIAFSYHIREGFYGSFVKNGCFVRSVKQGCFACFIIKTQHRCILPVICICRCRINRSAHRCLYAARSLIFFLRRNILTVIELFAVSDIFALSEILTFYLMINLRISL